MKNRFSVSPRLRGKQILRLGTRASNLALVQARWVARALERAHRGSGLRVELLEISTTGDELQKPKLSSFGGAGVFVNALERALRARRIDLAVHSLKDVPTRLPSGLVLAAISKREDVRDVAVLAGAKRLADLPAGAVIGSGSPRRRAQLALLHPHLRFAEIRGNVETRLRKVAAGRYAGTILARAGLNRLRNADCGLRIAAGAITILPASSSSQVHSKLKIKNSKLSVQTLPLAEMLPAPGQGALGIECRANDRRTRRLLAALNDPQTQACVRAERACLSALGGGCHLPLGAYANVAKGSGLLRLQAFLPLPHGKQAVWVDLEGAQKSPERLGLCVAERIKDLGAV